MDTFKISSSFGYLIIDSITGIVIKCNSRKSKDDYIQHIERFDVLRYKTANNCLLMPNDVDILRFAYWLKDGSYDTPAEGYEPTLSEEEFYKRYVH